MSARVLALPPRITDRYPIALLLTFTINFKKFIKVSGPDSIES